MQQNNADFSIGKLVTLVILAENLYGKSGLNKYSETIVRHSVTEIRCAQNVVNFTFETWPHWLLASKLCVIPLSNGKTVLKHENSVIFFLS